MSMGLLYLNLNGIEAGAAMARQGALTCECPASAWLAKGQTLNASVRSPVRLQLQVLVHGRLQTLQAVFH